MRLWTDALRGLLGLALAAGIAACGRPGGDEEQEDALPAPEAPAPTNAPIENLRIPLAVWPDGKVRTMLTAAAAQMPEETGDVQASQIRLEMFREDGALDNLVMAKDCRYNREKGVATSDSNVHVEREGVLLTGRGFEWNGSDEVVRVSSDVRMTLQRNIRFDGMAGLGNATKTGKEGGVVE